MTIIIFIIILAVLIFVHELGHFLSAKKSGVRVDEFALGFPPTIFSKKISETKYSLNLIPFGGFVKIFGEDPSDEVLKISEKDKNRSFYYKSGITQIFILGAGVLMNILLGFILISIGFMIGMPTPEGSNRFGSVSDSKLTITSVLPDSPAKKSGINSGDVVLFATSANKSLQASDLNSENLTNLISNSSGEIDLLIKSGDNIPKNIKVLPTEDILKDRKAIGVSMANVGILKLPFHKAFLEGAIATKDLLVSIVFGLYDFFKGVFTFKADLSDVSGPVGIVSIVGEASKLGFVYLISLTALISLNLAVINLIPFPALDGGRILFVLIEEIFRKKINPKFQVYANAVGFALLIILMISITIKDIAKL